MGSNTPIYFAPESGGYASFQINESSMQRVGNLTVNWALDTFEDTLSDINGLGFCLTLVMVQLEMSFMVVGMDNIQLITIPEPSFIAFRCSHLVLSLF